MNKTTNESRELTEVYEEFNQVLQTLADKLDEITESQDYLCSQLEAIKKELGKL